MIRISTKILIFLAFLLTDLLSGFSFGQSNTNFEEYFIRYERINFKFLDSIYKATVFIEPNGYFLFRDGFVDSSHPGRVKYRKINDKAKTFTHKDSFVLKSEDIKNVDNLFPLPFYNGDSSILNHYPYEYKPINYYYNLEYSYILNLLEGKKLYCLNNKKILRIIEPEETAGISRVYSVTVLDFNRKKLYYKKGRFNAKADYQIEINDSIRISDKHLKKAKTIIDEIDFKSVKYFTEIGPNIGPMYLIEYCNSNDYFVFEKPIFSPNKHDKNFKKILTLFWKLNANIRKK